MTSGTTAASLTVGDQAHPLGPQATVIGSGYGADVRIDHPGVLTHHAQVSRSADGSWVIEAFGAVECNGSDLQGPRPLSHDDVLEIGGRALRFNCLPVTTKLGSVPIPANGLRIGRATDNDVVVAHAAAAAYHAEIIKTPQGYRLRDLSSTSGTRLNGEPVQGALLGVGDEIGIADRAWSLDGEALLPIERPTMPLRAHRVTVRVGSTVLLHPVSITVVEREMMAIIGPSGSGKSTLLHVLAGLRRPSEGHVSIHGDDVSVREADIGFVPQEDTVHRLLTGREALRFAAELRLPADVATEQRDRVVANALEEVGLSPVADQRVSTLSGGQRKRVAVAAELIGDPSLLLLDEPTTGLDPGLEQRVMTVARALADSGRSVILVTHATQSLHMCDRLVVLAPGGWIAYVGPPSEAPAAFGVSRLEDIYALLSDGWRPPDSPATDEDERDPTPPALNADAVPRRSMGPQARTLTKRYATLLIRDRRNLKLLVLQVVVLSLAAALLFAGDVFTVSNGQALHAQESAQLLFVLVTIALWFGAVSAVRQIVGERHVVRRELAAGVRTEAYLLAKCGVLGAVVTSQTVILTIVVLSLRDVDGGGASLCLVLVGCALVGMTMGLVVSSLARSEDQATSFLPLVLLPQLLFGGAIVPVAQLGQPIRALSALAASQWGFSGAGRAVDLHERISSDVTFGPVSRYGDGFFQRPIPLILLVLALMAAVCIAVLQAQLRPSFEESWFETAHRRVRLNKIETAPDAVESGS